MDLSAAQAALEPWLPACEARLHLAVPGYEQKPTAERLQLVLQQCLLSDFNLGGGRCLPPGVQSLHATTLSGSFLLQLDEAVGIHSAAKQRYQPGGGGNRCHKVILTDGAQQVVGLEYQPCPALDAFLPAGTKVVVHSPRVRRGVLLLTPANLVVLGGGVERLEQARQRAVEQWNQPVVGRRGPPAQIAEVRQQATEAAWAAGGGQQQALRPEQQHGQPPQPRLALEALQPQAAAPQRQALHLPPPPAANMGQQQRQQQGHPAVAGRGPTAEAAADAGAGGSASFGSLPLRQRLEQRQAAGGSQSFSFGGQQQQHSQRFGLADGAGGGPQQQQPSGNGRALQPVNQGGAGGAGSKRSRLALSKPENFSFVQPGSMQQQQQTGRPPPAEPTRPPVAAGTVEDPIVIDDCGLPAGPSSGLAAQQPQQQGQQQQQPGDDDPANWQDNNWSDDWGKPADEGTMLEPYEVGYDEQDDGPAEHDEAAVPDEEWEEEALGEDGGDWEDEAGSGQQRGGQGAEGMQLDAGEAAAPGAALADVEMQDAVQPPTRPAAGAAAAAGGGAAVPAPAQAAQPAAAAARRSEDRAPAKAVPCGRKRQVIESDDELSEDTTHEVEAAEQSLPQPPPSRLRPRSDGLVLEPSSSGLRRPAPPAAGPAASTAGGAAAAAPLQPQATGPPAGTGLALEPLDDSLLAPAPSLLDLKAGSAAVLAPLPRLAPLPLSSASPRVLSAATPSGSSLQLHSRGSGGRRSSGLSGGPALKVNPSGSRTLQPLPARPTLSAASAVPAAALRQPLPGVVVVGGESDDESPVFDGLVSEDESALAGAAAGGGGMDGEPFTYLHLLAQRAKSADPEFPITAKVYGLVKTMAGKLAYENPATGEPEYHAGMLIEDGSMVCQAVLGHQFLQDFFDCPPQQLKAQLADPATRPAAMELVKALQRHLSQFCGLMAVVLPAPGAALEVRDLGDGPLSPAQAAALQQRAMR